ncbi:hypothetical protein BOTBODRAFT_371100 [Botryobasidium botryosum FD-172 SS1]|uniref:Uncharacterized protein n=1 Tax=Botryobasidium botryosum (strain FD-172 SS1) TaxID=930990 RepID=A0A067MFS9_BOTB1|nr:hypothetical protein BOTBODRAFT_371100 [Botryobasidium botryosum FD-172 SS1]
MSPGVDSAKSKLTFAYYCSGHGFGHATRVSAFAAQLLSLQPAPAIHIVSSAPSHVFANALARGARYRHAYIDPVIAQPVAYRVDRAKSVAILEDFLGAREGLIREEVEWLKANDVDCVLSDAAFMPCAAANTAGLPAVLITNFTFDSIWSFLSTAIKETPPTQLAPAPPSPDSNQPHPEVDIAPDEPIPESVLAPLVAQMERDYSCADLLLLLPGAIPIPSFVVSPALPSPAWVDVRSREFRPEVLDALDLAPESLVLRPAVALPDGLAKSRNTSAQRERKRKVLEAPLIVRRSSPDIYTQAGRERLLDSIGVPRHMHDRGKTKVLVVSFGGQVFKRPAPVHAHSLDPAVLAVNTSLNATTAAAAAAAAANADNMNTNMNKTLDDSLLSARLSSLSLDVKQTPRVDFPSSSSAKHHLQPLVPAASPLIATSSHLYIPGSPGPASNPSSPYASRIIALPKKGVSLLEHLEQQQFQQSRAGTDAAKNSEQKQTMARLLPEDWIAIVCGAGDAWGVDQLPEGFFVAPQDVYMPDVTAVGDVLLGKLGYGTVSECVDACTPMIFGGSFAFFCFKGAFVVTTVR